MSTTESVRVPFLDLRRRVESIRPSLEARLHRVFDHGRFILGDAVEELEREFSRYCGVHHGIGVASGTDALWLALEAFGVGPGDEVVTVSHTCVPTVVGILKSGATPVLVDVDPDTMTMDPESAAASVTNRTKAILPVHLYGQCADLEPLRQLADRAGIFLIEDCAQAHGAEYRGTRAGRSGHAGCFSFYPTKNLGGLGDGGMVVTDDANLADRLRLLRNYGYTESSRSIMTGYNSRLDEVQAAIILEGLKRLDGWNERRREIAGRYASALARTDVHPPKEAAYAQHIYHLYVVRTRERERLRERLKAVGIETMVHYPVPVHRQQGYAQRCRIGTGGLKHTERLAEEIVSLPLFPELREDEIQAVIDGITASEFGR